MYDWCEGDAKCLTITLPTFAQLFFWGPSGFFPILDIVARPLKLEKYKVQPRVHVRATYRLLLVSFSRSDDRNTDVEVLLVRSPQPNRLLVPHDVLCRVSIGHLDKSTNGQTDAHRTNGHRAVPSDRHSARDPRVLFSPVSHCVRTNKDAFAALFTTVPSISTFTKCTTISRHQLVSWLCCLACTVDSLQDLRLYTFIRSSTYSPGCPGWCSCRL